jgi:Zn-dependent protease
MYVFHGRDEIELPESLSVITASLAIAFGFDGIRLLNIIARPLGYSTGVLIGALIGFLVHEYAHKYAAVRESCMARFTLSKRGMLITLLSGILVSIGIPFAILAPGYVRIAFCWGAPREENIAMAGPLSNIALSFIAIIVAKSIVNYHLVYLFTGFADINAWFALFNLLPLYPLDGSKIFSRNIAAWILLFILAAYLALVA